MKFNPDKHRQVLEHIRPRFATLRDYFSEEDCNELGIQYYSVEDILAFYEQVKPFIRSPIFIPNSYQQCEQRSFRQRAFLSYRIRRHSSQRYAFVAHCHCYYREI